MRRADSVESLDSCCGLVIRQSNRTSGYPGHVAVWAKEKATVGEIDILGYVFFPEELPLELSTKPDRWFDFFRDPGNHVPGYLKEDLILSSSKSTQLIWTEVQDRGIAIDWFYRNLNSPNKLCGR
jgi:hypothetical protein